MAEVATKAPESSAGATIKLWGLQYDPHIARYEMLAEAFEKSSGIKIELEPQAWPLETKVIAALSAGTAPDVSCIMGKMLLPLIKQDAVMEIDDIVFAEAGVKVEDWFNPGAIGAYFYDGHYYGVPVEGNMVAISLGGRMDMIEAAGDKVQGLWPSLDQDQFESYEQVWSLAEVLQQSDDAGNVSVWGLNEQGWDTQVLLSIHRSLGGQWWDPEGKKFNLDTELMVKALDYYITIPVFERKIETALDVNHVDAIVAGKCALAGRDGGLAGHASRADVVVEAFQAPSPEDGKPALIVGEGGWGFEGISTTKKQAEAVKFLQWMTTFDAQYIWAGIYGGIASAIQKIDASNDLFAGDDPTKRSVRRILKSSPNTEYYGWGFGAPGKLEEIGGAMCEKVRTGGASAAEGAKEFQEQMEAHFQEEMGDA
ncbi:MAG: ABC transporter substrate-binding protein [Anaerolineae bacterium]